MRPKDGLQFLFSASKMCVLFCLPVYQIQADHHLGALGAALLVFFIDYLHTDSPRVEVIEQIQAFLIG